MKKSTKIILSLILLLIFITIIDILFNDIKIYIRLSIFTIFGYFLIRAYKKMEKTKEELMESHLKIIEKRNNINNILDNCGDGIIAMDCNGIVKKVNKATLNILECNSYKNVLGKHISDVIQIKSTEDYNLDKLLDKIDETEEIQYIYQCKIKTKKDNEILISDSIAPIFSHDIISGYVLVFRDITRELELKSKIEHQHKIEAIGVLAGGIAHDFNNILTGILGNISISKLLIEKNSYGCEEKGTILDRLDKSETSIQKAKDLTYQLLTFSKGGNPVKNTFNISDMIKDNVEFALSGSNILHEFNLEPKLWSINADRGQINQVLQNMVINAVQAMSDGGYLKISAYNVHKNNNKYVKISISDTGCGIPEEIRTKIFDPYFTTKKDGSGIGLSVAFSIIKKHDGYIDVDTYDGLGTTFNIYLPAISFILPIQNKKYKYMENEPIGQNQKILIMDDEEHVLDVLKSMLEILEFDVITATNGEEAIYHYKKNKPILTILDLTIRGGMGGKITAEKLLEFDEKAKIIVSSGYSNDPIMSDFQDYGFIDSINKPYVIDDIYNKLKELL